MKTILMSVLVTGALYAGACATPTPNKDPVLAEVTRLAPTFDESLIELRLTGANIAAAPFADEVGPDLAKVNTWLSRLDLMAADGADLDDEDVAILVDAAHFELARIREYQNRRSLETEIDIERRSFVESTEGLEKSE